MKYPITQPRMRALTPMLLCLVLLTATTLFLPATDLTYTTTTRVEMSGALGRAVNVLSRLGGGSNEITETVYVTSNALRRDADETSSIIDLEGERYITLDNEKKTYSVVTFAEFQQRMEEAVEQAKGEMQEAQAETSPDQAGSDVEVSFDMDVTRTGKKQTIQGFPAEQVFMTLSATATNTAPETPDEPTQGTMVVSMELWMTDQLQAFDVENAFYQQMAERMGETMLESGQNVYEGLAAVMTQHPGMKEGLEKAAEEAAKMEGREVKTITRIVLVPEGVTFDPVTAFAAEEAPAEEKPRRGRGLAKGILRQAIGAGDTEEPQNEEAPTKPATLVTITTELSAYETSPLSSSLFEIPSGYKQVDY